MAKKRKGKKKEKGYRIVTNEWPGPINDMKSEGF